MDLFKIRTDSRWFTRRKYFWGWEEETKSNQNRRWVTGIIYFPRGQFTMSKFTQELKKSFTNTE